MYDLQILHSFQNTIIILLFYKGVDRLIKNEIGHIISYHIVHHQTFKGNKFHSINIQAFNLMTYFNQAV